MRKNIPILFILTIVLFYFSFPPFPTGFLSYFVLIPFFLLLELNAFQSGFRTGYLLGLFATGAFLSWLNMNSGATQMQATGMYLGSIMYLACWWGLFAVLQNYFCRRFGLNGFWAAPFLWTAFDFLQSFSDLRFTLHSLATTQTYYMPFIQFIEYTGMFGITFWVVTLNVFFFFIYKRITTINEKIPKIKYLLIGIAVVFLIPAVHGLWTLKKSEGDNVRIVRCAVVQPNIEPNQKWLERDFAFSKVMEQMQTVREHTVDMVVWPETAIPNRLRYDRKRFETVRDELKLQWTPLITGIPDRTLIDDEQGKTISRSRNAIFLLRPDTSSIQFYYKMQLVLFGEYVPEYLHFIQNIAMDIGDFGYLPGDEHKVFELPLYNEKKQTDSVAFAGVICLESIFPDFVRQFMLRGARFLVIVTNDAWYDGTFEPVQHAQCAVLRAIENRISIARAANSGVSSIIDPYGRVLQQTQNGTDDVLFGDISIIDRPTLFLRYGNWFGWTMIIVVMSGILVVKIRY
ncbi:apolipoprotein N-acyltransferase [bacterium]|nr:apolipoprotein N-acyltransferase [bacterium]